jgi:hypothetical protein
MKFPRPSQAHTPAVLALIAALGGAFATPAQAQSSSVTPAIACNAADANGTRPTRSWGARNYGPTAIEVTCPINRPNGFARVYGVMAHGNSAGFGEHAKCLLISMRKSDGYTMAIKSFVVTGFQAGMQGTWVFLEPWERHYDTVQEVQCTLPANGRAWLTAFEAFAG